MVVVGFSVHFVLHVLARIGVGFSNDKHFSIYTLKHIEYHKNKPNQIRSTPLG